MLEDFRNSEMESTKCASCALGPSWRAAEASSSEPRLRSLASVGTVCSERDCKEVHYDGQLFDSLKCKESYLYRIDTRFLKLAI